MLPVGGGSQQFNPLRNPPMPMYNPLIDIHNNYPSADVISPLASPSSFYQNNLMGGGSHQQPVFNFNGTVFPHLATLSPMAATQVPVPARFSFQNHFKFLQDLSVNVK